MINTLKEAHRLWCMGFALHFLRPKSKIPIKSQWTTGPRAQWKELKNEFKNDYNLGVRLGDASRFSDGTFLAAVDCDVKSKDPKHLAEMRACLQKYIRVSAPMVLSGRGNGSAHYYYRTKLPEIQRRISQSNEKVKLRMPSAKPSRYEKETLSEKEIKEGIRLRAAWEIAIMGEGQQIALPPSIHPDSGKPYKWGIPINDVFDLPVLDLSHIKAPEKSEKLKADISKFTVQPDTLEELNLPKKLFTQIREGEGVEDRSASLLGVTIALYREGLDDNDVLTILTDRENFLGNVAYDHAETKNRDRAAYWLQKYTLPKAKAEVSLARVFSDVSDELPKLNAEEAAKQLIEIFGPDHNHWRKQLDRTKDGQALKASLKNVREILIHSVNGALFIHNEFSMRDSYGEDAPWGAKKGSELKDSDAIRIKNWFTDKWKIEPNVGLIFEAMVEIALRNKFHPVREYLEPLKWDGKSRVDGWLKNYLGAVAPEPYLSAVSRKILCAAIARIMSPGVKFDHVLILEGKQGVGKSSAAQILASPAWFSDALPDVKDKDARLNLLGNWIVEVSELASLKRADSETYKAFFSAQADRVRAPYGKRWEEFKRQCIFIGTTNAQDYLKDRSGNRRFWPVEVNQCKFVELQKDRDQLFAEAKMLWEEFDESLYLDDPKSKAQAEKIQENKIGEDLESSMNDEFLEYSETNKTFGQNKFSLRALFGIGFPFERYKEDQMHLMLAGKILNKNGFEKYASHGQKFWRKSGPISQ